MFTRYMQKYIMQIAIKKHALALGSLHTNGIAIKQIFSIDFQLTDIIFAVDIIVVMFYLSIQSTLVRTTCFVYKKRSEHIKSHSNI